MLSPAAAPTADAPILLPVLGRKLLLPPIRAFPPIVVLAGSNVDEIDAFADAPAAWAVIELPTPLLMVAVPVIATGLVATSIVAPALFVAVRLPTVTVFVGRLVRSMVGFEVKADCVMPAPAEAPTAEAPMTFDAPLLISALPPTVTLLMVTVAELVALMLFRAPPPPAIVRSMKLNDGVPDVDVPTLS